jgi:hypothetical protein
LKFEQKSQAILPVFEIGKMFTEQEYKDIFIPEIIELFSIPDKFVRLNIMKNMKTMIPFLDNSTIQSKIYPVLQLGFVDLIPAIREATVKSMIDIVPKLTEDVVSNEVVKYMWKLQTDPEPGIRTNTIIAFGRLVPTFSEKVRSEWVINAFSRSLRDPFVHSRVSVIKAIMATKQFFTVTDKGGKILAMVAPMTVDSDKQVREQSLNCMYAILQDIAPIVSEESFGEKDKEEKSATNSSDGYLSWALNSVASIGKKTNEPTSGGTTNVKPLENTSSSYMTPKIPLKEEKKEEILMKSTIQPMAKKSSVVVENKPKIESKPVTPQIVKKTEKKKEDNWDNIEDTDTWEEDVFSQFQEKKNITLTTKTVKKEIPKKKEEPNLDDFFGAPTKTNTTPTTGSPGKKEKKPSKITVKSKKEENLLTLGDGWDFDLEPGSKKKSNEINWDEF